MTDPWARAPMGPPPVRCPVCGTDNEASRQFCRKCASELRPGTVPPVAEEDEPRISPVLVAGIAALVLLAIAAVAAFALLGGGAPASPSPSAGPPTASVTAAPTVAVSAEPPPTATTAPTATLAPAPTPTPAPPPTPTILSFDAPRRANCSDPSFPGTISLSWQVAAAEAVTISIDGTGIFDTYEDIEGSAVVPFACGEEQHTYLLTTVGGSGPPDSEEVVVRRR